MNHICAKDTGGCYNVKKYGIFLFLQEIVWLSFDLEQGSMTYIHTCTTCKWFPLKWILNLQNLPKIQQHREHRPDSYSQEFCAFLPFLYCTKSTGFKNSQAPFLRWKWLLGLDLKTRKSEMTTKGRSQGNQDVHSNFNILVIQTRNQKSLLKYFTSGTQN